MSDQSFTKAQRLLKNRDFQKVFTEGEKKFLPCLALHWLKIPGDQQTRVGLSVGRKTANAVRRNRIKRRLRELLRTYPQAWPPGYWLVIVAKGECVTMETEKLKNLLYQSLKEVFKKNL